LLGLVLAAGVLAGCGGAATVAGHTGDSTATAPPPPAVVKAKRAAARKRQRRAASVAAAKAPVAKAGRGPRVVHTIAPARASRAAVARVDASSDAVLVKVEKSGGNAIVSKGAPSDAEVRQEIAEAQKAGFSLPSGNTAASFAASAAQASISNAAALAVGASIPDVPWNPNQRPMADWIVPVLQWASQHGWTGTVTSGYRTYFQQAALNAAGAFSAPAGYSNHESTAYPGGAVDVTQPGELIKVLAAYPGPLKLVGGVLGPIDPEHFSATGA
jgi:uncharacterized protein with NAD-binding domain and iron-sulfur cluster